MSEAGDIVDWVTTEVPSIAGRIYPIVLPSGRSPDEGPILPAITYQLVSEPQDPVQEGPGMAEPRYRFKVWAKSYAQLEPIVRQLAVAFNGRHDGPFRASLVDGSLEDRDQATGRYWRIVDVLGWQPAAVALGS